MCGLLEPVYIGTMPYVVFMKGYQACMMQVTVKEGLRIELISDHLPDLQFCHKKDVSLYSLFAQLTRLTSLPHVRCRLIQAVSI